VIMRKLKMCSCGRPVRGIPQKNNKSIRVSIAGSVTGYQMVYPSKQAKDGKCVQCHNFELCGKFDIQPNYVSGGILPSNENGRKRV